MDSFGRKMGEHFSIVAENVASRLSGTLRGDSIATIPRAGYKKVSKTTTLAKRRTFDAKQISVSFFLS